VKPDLRVVIRGGQSDLQGDSRSINADADFDLVIYWSSFVDTNRSSKYLSLPAIVDANALVVRDRILNFIDSIRLFEVNGKSIEDSLRISGDFSYWWLTLPALKRWQESSRLFDLARLFALDLTLAGQNIAEVVVEIDDRDVCSCIQHFAKYYGATYRSTKKVNRNRLRKAQLHSLPWNRLRAFALLTKLLTQAVLRRLSPISPVSTDIQATHVFFDYFDTGSETPTTHYSRFWSPLQNELRKLAVKTLWIHIVPEMRSLRQFKQANKICGEFSQNMVSEKHIPLDTIPTFSRWLRVLKIYTLVAKANRNVLRACEQSVKEHPSLCFLPLLRPQIIDSLIGTTAVQHCNLVASFEELQTTVVAAQFIVYPLENQPWEKTLLGLYKDKTDAHFIGAPHSVIKFWDLRFFEAKNSNSEFRTFQYPNTVAINSNHTRTTGDFDRFPSCNIVDVEALRYLGLADRFPTRRTQARVGERTILILGDFLPRATKRLISMTDHGLKRFMPKVEVIFKPHPLQSSNTQTIPDDWILSNDPILALMENANIVIMTSSASAVIEARSLGKPTILIIDPNVFDYSILRNEVGIIRVTNENEMADALARASSQEFQALHDFFTLDLNLPRWKELLELEPV